jgi:hypothetical protein
MFRLGTESQEFLVCFTSDTNIWLDVSELLNIIVCLACNMANSSHLTNSMKHNLAWDWLLVVPVGETRQKTTHFTHKNPPLVPVWATPYVRLHLPNGPSSSSAPPEEGHSLLTPVRILQSRPSLVTSKNYKAQYYAFYRPLLLSFKPKYSPQRTFSNTVNILSLNKFHTHAQQVSL